MSYDRSLTRMSRLDVHLADACNLSCEQCTHYSDYQIANVISIHDIKKNYSAWHTRIVPNTIALTGGEPLLNPRIEDIVTMTRYYWPDSIIEIWTNGFLLRQHPELPKLLYRHNVMLHISNHGAQTDIKYQNLFDDVLAWVRTWANLIPLVVFVHNHSLGKVHVSQNFDVDHRTIDMLPKSRFYQGHGPDMLPYDHHDPENSYKNCPASQEGYHLRDRRIYKCAPLAYLPLLDEKFGLKSQWDRYLAYKPLEASASDQEIREFFQRRAEPECAMCPSQRIPLHDHKSPLGTQPIMFVRKPKEIKVDPHDRG